MGTRMKVKLLEVDEETERLVFSNRRASSETQMAGHKVSAPEPVSSMCCWRSGCRGPRSLTRCCNCIASRSRQSCGLAYVTSLMLA